MDNDYAHPREEPFMNLMKWIVIFVGSVFAGIGAYVSYLLWELSKL
jgi:hypothetical protein